MSLNIAAAKTFLDTLAPAGIAFRFRTIPESPGCEVSARKYHGTLNEVADDLDAASKSGAGVFVVINAGGDTNPSITKVRAIFLDLDRKTFANQDECDAAIRFAHEGRKRADTVDEAIPSGWPHASIVVRSGGGGAHLYWLVEGCPMGRFKGVQHALAARYGGDPAVCNLSRVMRLPGSLHCKGKAVAVAAPVCKLERRYKLDDLLARLGVSEEAPSAEPEASDFVAAGRPLTDAAVQAMRDALKRLGQRQPDAVHDRTSWLKVMTSIAAHGWGDVGMQIACGWSMQSNKFDAERFEVDWRSLTPEGGITASSLYWMAGPESDCPAGTDQCNAEQFREYLGGQVNYARGQWLVWSGSHWRADTNKVKSLAQAFAKERVESAVRRWLQDRDDASAKLEKRAAEALMGVQKQAAMLTSLEVQLHIPDEALDSDPWSLTVPNGAIELRSGRLQSPNPETYSTRCAGVAFNPNAKCPLWERFLKQTFQGDNDVIAYVQRWAGYMLTGSQQEEKLLFGFGNGRNGKSVFANLLAFILGTYAVQADSSLLTAKRREAGNASPELVRLAGVRLALLNETREGSCWNDADIKALVSTERIVARPLYRDPVSFFPTAKLFLRGNAKPHVKDTSDGIWRRVDLLNFPNRLTEAQAEHDLECKLKTEAEGILAWAVRGCSQWLEQRLSPPASVVEAVAEYRGTQDRLGEWIEVRQVEHGGFSTRSELLDDFTRHSGLRTPPTAREFAQKLRDRGYAELKRQGDRGFKVTFRPGHDF